MHSAGNGTETNAHEQDAMGDGESYQLSVDPFSEQVVYAADVLDRYHKFYSERNFSDTIIFPECTSKPMLFERNCVLI